MSWKTGAWWVAAIALTLTLYGWWAEGVRRTLRRSAAPTAAGPQDEELLLYIHDPLGPRAKTSCTMCNAEQEKIFQGMQTWARNMKQRGVLEKLEARARGAR